MREIKFRLRGRDNKTVGYEKWYSGTWHPPHPQNGAGIADGYWTARPLWLYSIDGKRWTPTYIPHTYKEQYTGREDKNGVEICEGDVLENHLREPVVIEFDTGKFGFRHNQSFAPLSFLDYRRVLVIGNRYENPELLK